MLNLDRVLRQLARLLVPAYAVLLLSFVLPQVSLDGSLAVAAYWIAESGDTYGLPFLAIILLGLLVGRSGINADRRLREAGLMLAIGGLHLAGGAYINENGIKPWFHIARPNIVALAETGTLRMPPDDFYALGDKAKRTAYLETVLAAADYSGPRLDASVRRHWGHMTGYSFPSGHSFSSMLAATFFLAMGITFLPRQRLLPFYVMVPWALAVCYSRVILRVHSPLDICVGALQGIAVGIVAYLIVRLLLGPSADSAIGE